MKEQFVTYEIALKLKELGFDEDCFAHYCNGDLITKTAILKSSTMLYYRQDNINPYQQYAHKNCTAPIWQQVIDWFRESKNVHITIRGDNFNSLYEFTGYGFQIFKTKWNPSSENIILYSSPSLEEFTYNNAREQAILKALELIK